MNDHDGERLINEGEHIVLSLNETLREIASVEHVTIETPRAYPAKLSDRGRKSSTLTLADLADLL